MKKIDTKVESVIQVLPKLNFGGVEKTTIELANYLVDNGVKSIILCAPNGNWLKQLHQDVIVEKYPSIASKNPFKIIANIFLIIKIIKKHNVQIIHARSRAPAWSCYFVKKILKEKIKFITTFHGTYSFKNRLKKKYNSVMTKGDEVIAVSEFIKNHIIDNYDIPENKIKVIRCGLTIEKYDPEKISLNRINKILNDNNLPVDKKIILLPARLTPIKGHSFVLDAISKMNENKKNNDLYFLFAGGDATNSEYYRNLLKKIFNLKIIDKVNIISSVSDIQALYMCSYCTISPSIKPESFGRTIVESQAIGVPAIVSDIGAPKECIKQYENGLIFKVNDVDSFLDCLNWIVNLSTDDYLKMREKTRKSVLDNPSLYSMREETLRLYNSLYED